MYLCVPQTGVESTLNVLILSGCGGMPPVENVLKVRCQKSEFGGTSANKITCVI